MQNISFGNQQSYPAYPNCFDLLAIHGVVAEDPMGYITGNPSPFLQNYVAQRGGVPSLPGQLMPDNLPQLPQNVPLARGDVYQNSKSQMIQPPLQTPNYQSQIPKVDDLTSKTFNKNGKLDTFKKIAAAALLTGLAVFGFVKGKGLVGKLIKKTPSVTPPPAPAATATTATSAAATTTATTTAASSSKAKTAGFFSRHKKGVIGGIAGVLGLFGLYKLFGSSKPNVQAENNMHSAGTPLGSQSLSDVEQHAEVPDNSAETAAQEAQTTASQTQAVGAPPQATDVQTQTTVQQPAAGQTPPPAPAQGQAPSAISMVASNVPMMPQAGQQPMPTPAVRV